MESIVNIQDINNKRSSIAKVLLIFYVLIAGNYTDNLMAKQLREYISENRLIQHLIGLMTMVILITTIGGVVDSRTAIIYSLVSYTWFIFSTKLDIHWNIIILLLLFFGYLYENDVEIREEEVMSDKTLDDKKKMEIINKHNRNKTLFIGGILAITLVGTLFYSHKKHVQYGGGYDIISYLLY